MTDTPHDEHRDETAAHGPGETPPPGPDPRLRPADPAGTQPKFDPAALRPSRPLVVGGATLWAPPGERDEDIAEPEVRPRREDEAPAAADDGDVAQAPEYSRYSHRVQFALGALLAVAAAAIVLLVAGIVGSGGGERHSSVALRSGPAWSDWHPKATGGIDAAEEIADHVGLKYRLPNGQQLVGVTPTALQFGDVPLTIAINQPAAQGGVDFLDGTGVWFHMCDFNGNPGTMSTGSSEDCAIRFGKPSKNRHMLLRREALELALYSFRYLGVTEVVVSLPPAQVTSMGANGKQTVRKGDPQALLFRSEQGDLRTALDHQLDATLSDKAPSVSTVTRWPDAGHVRTLTDSRVFNYRLQASNTEARGFMVMTPLPIR